MIEYDDTHTPCGARDIWTVVPKYALSTTRTKWKQDDDDKDSDDDNDDDLQKLDEDKHEKVNH